MKTSMYPSDMMTWSRMLFSLSRRVSFSNDAIQYAGGIKDPKIVLIDGETLAERMIQFGIGVASVNTYLVKKIDTEE